jgi:hypothetical protein
MSGTVEFNGSQEQWEALVEKNYLIGIAKVCHQANKAWCESQGDLSQPDWADAPEWQVQSAINGVKFRLENPDAGPDAMHNSWSAEKVSQGWVYGEVKDAEKKTHPCLVPFDQLPLFQQKKDKLFSVIVDALK